MLPTSSVPRGSLQPNTWPDLMVNGEPAKAGHSGAELIERSTAGVEPPGLTPLERFDRSADKERTPIRPLISKYLDSGRLLGRKLIEG